MSTLAIFSLVIGALVVVRLVWWRLMRTADP